MPAGWTRDRMMKWDELEEQPCSLARTVAVIGDRWSLLILRECFLRKRRFEAFQSALGITRHLLAERLKKLVRLGVLRRIPYQESPKRYEYILTQNGIRGTAGRPWRECGLASLLRRQRLEQKERPHEDLVELLACRRP